MYKKHQLSAVMHKMYTYLIAIWCERTNRPGLMCVGCNCVFTALSVLVAFVSYSCMIYCQ